MNPIPTSPFIQDEFFLTLLTNSRYFLSQQGVLLERFVWLVSLEAISGNMVEWSYESWATVCDEHWDDLDASVVCHQLGYSRYG